MLSGFLYRRCDWYIGTCPLLGFNALTARACDSRTQSLPQTRRTALLLALITLLSGSVNCIAETIYRSDGAIETSGFRYPFPAPRVEQDSPSAENAPVKTPSAVFKHPSSQAKNPQRAPYASTADTPSVPPSIATDKPEYAEAETLPAITARVAIIIDDIGYNLKQGLRSARFPGPLTLAVLPHTPNGFALAELGFESGKAIMLHAPMSNLRQTQLDPGGLTADMTRDEFIRTLRHNIEAIPHIIGINNHMGSYLTQLHAPMNWLMTELKHQQLFFIDSRTSADSQAWEIAQQHGLSSHKRDVFLDHERESSAIEKQFERMVQLAKRRGSALAIGHPYPETLSVLEQQVPLLRRQGIELVTIERLLPRSPVAIQSNALMTTGRSTTGEL